MKISAFPPISGSSKNLEEYFSKPVKSKFLLKPKKLELLFPDFINYDSDEDHPPESPEIDESKSTGNYQYEESFLKIISVIFFKIFIKKFSAEKCPHDKG